MTTDSTQNSGRGRIALLAILTIAVVGVIVFAMIQQNIGRGGESAAPTSTATTEPTSASDASLEGDDDVSGMSVSTGKFLDKELNGQEAIDALGENIEAVAKRNGRTAEELKDVLLTNKSAFVTPNGFLVFKDGITKK